MADNPKTPERESDHKGKTPEISQLPKSIRRDKCLAEMKERIDNGVRYSKTVMANKWGFDWHTIARWEQKIFLARAKEPIDLTSTKSEQTIETSLMVLQKIIANPETREEVRLSALQKQGQYLELQAKLLEMYGRKPTATQNIKVEQEVTVKSKFEVPETLRHLIDGNNA